MKILEKKKNKIMDMYRCTLFALIGGFRNRHPSLYIQDLGVT